MPPVRGCHEGEGDDTIRLLRVIGAVAEAHVGGTEQWSLPKTRFTLAVRQFRNKK